VAWFVEPHQENAVLIVIDLAHFASLNNREASILRSSSNAIVPNQ
jgi:hypothetical protein